MNRCYLCLISLAILTGSANAAFLTSVDVRGYVVTESVIQFQQNAGGLSTTSAHVSDGAIANSVVSAASASVCLLPALDPGIRLSTSTGGPFGRSEAQASAQWLDTIFVSDNFTSDLLLQFRITGIMLLQSGLDGGAAMGIINATVQDTSSNITRDSNFFQDDVRFGVNTPPFTEQFGFSRSYDVYLSVVLKYDSTLQGYSFGLDSTALSFSLNSSYAVVDFGHTIRLTSVTNADGSAVSGITFDSGFQLNSVPVSPVPAPPGMLLTAIGIGTLLGGRSLRRRS